MARESEYGGDETLKSQGVQPKQLDADLSVAEQLRLLRATDPAELGSIPDRFATPVYLRKEG